MRTFTINDKRISFYSSADTEKQAIKEIEKQMITYQEKKERGLFFSEVAEEWEIEHFPTLQHNTLKQYKPALKQVTEYFDGYRIDEIQPFHINALINSLAKKQYAYKTVKSRLLVVSLIMKYAIINQYITANPCQYIRIPKHLPKTKRSAATDSDAFAIRNNIDKPFGLFAYFLLMTGCRRGEALALTPNDIDFKNKTVSINKTVEWIGSKPNIKNSPKTDAGNRQIPLTDNLITLLKPLRKQAFLFPNEKGELMNNSQVTRAWNDYKQATGIEVTPHQLRHSYQTMLFDAGIDIKTAQKWLGHSDIKTTLDVYTHLSDTRLNNSTEKLNEYVKNNA